MMSLVDFLQSVSIVLIGLGVLLHMRGGRR